MTDKWVTQPRKFCDYCRVWMASNKMSIQIHEQGKTHKENVKKYLEEVKNKGTVAKKEAEKLKQQMDAIESAALAAVQKDMMNNPSLAKDSSVKGKIQQIQTTTTPASSSSSAASANYYGYGGYYGSAYQQAAYYSGYDPNYGYYGTNASETHTTTTVTATATATATATENNENGTPSSTSSTSSTTDNATSSTSTIEDVEKRKEDENDKEKDKEKEKDQGDTTKSDSENITTATTTTTTTTTAAAPEVSPYGAWTKVERTTPIDDNHVGIKNPLSAMIAQAELNAKNDVGKRAGTAHFVESDDEDDYKVTFAEKTTSTLEEYQGSITVSKDSESGTEKVMFKKRKPASQGQIRKKPELSA